MPDAAGRKAVIVPAFAASLWVGLAGLLSADDDTMLSRSELVDNWGSILYCQAIYEEPSVRSRIYAGDRKSCGEAQDYLAGMAESFSPGTDSSLIAQEAARKAAAIRHNTRSVGEAVTACRQQCRKFQPQAH